MADAEAVGTIMGMMAESVRPQVIYLVTRLGVVDALLPAGTTKKSTEQLASELKVHSGNLGRVLRVAGQIGLLKEEAGETYSLTPLAAVLAETHPSNARYFALLQQQPLHAQSFTRLYDAVVQGKPGFTFVYGEGKTVFDIINADPLEKPVFEKAMTALTNAGSELLLRLDWSKYQKIVDVGGSEGALLKAVLSKAPGAQGVNFDIPAVINSLPPVEGPLAGRLTYASGDFFKPLPAEVQNANAITMKHIMHDWGDDACITILKHCAAALAPGGDIIVVDHLVPETVNAAPNSLPVFPFFADLVMMAVTSGGLERNLLQWSKLFSAAGLKPPEVVAAHPAGLSILCTQPL